MADALGYLNATSYRKYKTVRAYSDEDLLCIRKRHIEADSGN